MWYADRSTAPHAVVAVDCFLVDDGVVGAVAGVVVAAGIVVAAAAAGDVVVAELESYPQEALNSSTLSDFVQGPGCAIFGEIRYSQHLRLHQYLRWGLGRPARTDDTVLVAANCLVTGAFRTVVETVTLKARPADTWTLHLETAGSAAGW